jgi:hypothetical protein
MNRNDSRRANAQRFPRRASTPAVTEQWQLPGSAKRRACGVQPAGQSAIGNNHGVNNHAR